MENLKRYDPCNERMGRALVPGMTENKGGMYVKFSDIKDILNSTPNKQSESLLCGMCGEPIDGTCYVIKGIPFCINCPWEE